MCFRKIVTVVLLLLPCGCEAHESPCCQTARVVAFTASWCGPCQRAKPVLAQARAAGVDVQVVDIDDQPDLAGQYGIDSVPTFIISTGRGTERTHDAGAVLRLIGRHGP